MGFAATLEVSTSREFKVCGAIGLCSSLKKPGHAVSETQIGQARSRGAPRLRWPSHLPRPPRIVQGGTCAWSMGSITPASTVALYFEVVNQQAGAITAGKHRYLQLVTNYQHSSGRFRMRVTTVAGAWHTDTTNVHALAASFDQEAAAVLMARIATYRAHTEETTDILRWLDRCLIRLCAKVGWAVRVALGRAVRTHRPRRGAVCGLQEGPARVLPAVARVCHLPTVHVPLATLAVLADVQQQPGRDHVLSQDPGGREHHQQLGHDPARPHRLQL